MAKARSYTDPFYDDLDAKTAAEVGLPPGLLQSIRTKGERSNSDQVSEAGAKTVYQITPTTRKLILDKYGIDPYLSEENASKGAALLLKEGMQRNNGNPLLATAEYIGGTDRKNWGPVTKAYVRRVSQGLGQYAPSQTAAQPAAEAPAEATSASPPGEAEFAAAAQVPGFPTTSGAPVQSTFERVKAETAPKAPTEGQIANVFKAYQEGKMSPEDASAFEADVQAGKIMLPKGGALKGAAAAPSGPMVLPPGVVAAYVNNKMSPDERAELEADVRAGKVKMPETTAASASVIPGTQVVMPPGPEAQPTIAERAIGTGEAALGAGTAATTGQIGMIGGMLKGMAEQILSGQYGTPEAARLVEQSAQRGMQALTYAPRTEQGREQLAAVGEAAQVIPPVIPTTGPIGAIGESVAAARPIVAATAQRGAAAAQEAAAPIAAAAQKIAAPIGRAAETVRGMLPGGAAAESKAAGGSVGAAGVEQEALRRAAASELPVPMELTKGQATRDFAAQQFERETAKNAEVGAPLRERFAEQNQQLAQNMDAFIDATGAEAPDLRSVGQSVDKAIRSRASRDKAEIRSLYKAAEKAGEMSAPADLSPLAQYLNENRAGRSSAPIMQTIADELGVQGVGKGSLAEGTVAVGTVTLKQAEGIRKAINKFAKSNDPNDIRVANEMKNIIDAQTEGLGGAAYRQARAARARYANDYENLGIAQQLLGTKGGSADRAIALEDVVRRTILDPSTSLDSVRQVRKLLQTEGGQGQQAWRDLQGATVRHIRDEAMKNSATDQAGNRIVSAAALEREISKLDKSGKLDFVFGKKGAEQMRTLNDVAKTVLTSPPGSVNTSNTAVVLAGLLDTAMSGITGVPLPISTGIRIASSKIKDAKLRAKVKAALEQPKKQ